MVLLSKPDNSNTAARPLATVSWVEVHTAPKQTLTCIIAGMGQCGPNRNNILQTLFIASLNTLKTYHYYD
jgi:hypothetical protein